MKIKLAVALVCALSMAAVVSDAAVAATRKLFVTTVISTDNLCRAATEQVKWSYTFKAKIERKNSPLPSKVNVDYSVIDGATGQVYLHQKLTLKPRKYRAIGELHQYTAGANLVVRMRTSFKNPVSGRTLRSDNTFQDYAPSVEQMDAAGTKLSTCA